MGKGALCAVPTIYPDRYVEWWARFALPIYDSSVVATLSRRAFRQNALQGAAMHVQPSCGFGDVAVAHLVDALDVLPAHPVRRHRILRRLGLLRAAGKQGGDDIVGIGGL